MARSFGVLGRFQHYFFAVALYAVEAACTHIEKRRAERRQLLAYQIGVSLGVGHAYALGYIPFAGLAFAQAYALEMHILAFRLSFLALPFVLGV